jgi:hypothetical protein
MTKRMAALEKTRERLIIRLRSLIDGRSASRPRAGRGSDANLVDHSAVNGIRIDDKGRGRGKR